MFVPSSTRQAIFRPSVLPPFVFSPRSKRCNFPASGRFKLGSPPAPLFPVTIDLETLLPSLSITACVYNRHAARARLNLIPRVPIARHRFFPTTDSLRRFAGNNSDDFIARRYETRRHDRCLVRVRASTSSIRREKKIFEEILPSSLIIIGGFYEFYEIYVKKKRSMDRFVK